MTKKGTNQNEVANVKDFLEELYQLQLSTEWTDIYYKYPLETLVSLFGFINEEIYEPWSSEGDYNNSLSKIVSLNYDNVDADALFEDYINRWRYVFSSFTQLPMLKKIYDLENIMSNIVFSPNVFKIYDKLEKFKFR